MTTPISAVGYQAMATGTTGTTGTGTTGTTGTSGSSDSSTSSSSTSTKSLLDPQAFLQLLVAQLQYQDPSNPVDTSSFMNQTAMLSQVQSMTTMNTTLSALAQSQQAQSATSMIGKQVTYLNSAGLRVTGVATAASLLTTGATLQVDSTSVPLTSVVEVAAAPTS